MIRTVTLSDEDLAIIQAALEDYAYELSASDRAGVDPGTDWASIVDRVNALSERLADLQEKGSAR